jgi:phosphoglycerate dehydrogenase-like enzyme
MIARWGVGYDMIDVAACTANDVLLAITPEGVRRPVAEGILTLLLGLTHHLTRQDRLVRTDRWYEKTQYTSIGLAGRTLGSIGVGNIGTELFRLVQPFGLGRLLAYDPYVPAGSYAELGVEQVTLDTLLEASDFVCINCPLTPQTRHLIGEPELRRMRPTAFLINTARGPIIDQAALTRALQERWIGGAGLDVFEQEPVQADDPLLQVDNVILAPHAIAWTDALVRGNSVEACENVLTVFKGEVPRNSVNRAVVEQPGFEAKLRDLRTRGE